MLIYAHLFREASVLSLDRRMGLVGRPLPGRATIHGESAVIPGQQVTPTQEARLLVSDSLLDALVL